MSFGPCYWVTFFSVVDQFHDYPTKQSRTSRKPLKQFAPLERVHHSQAPLSLFLWLCSVVAVSKWWIKVGLRLLKSIRPEIWKVYSNVFYSKCSMMIPKKQSPTARKPLKQCSPLERVHHSQPPFTLFLCLRIVIIVSKWWIEAGLLLPKSIRQEIWNVYSNAFYGKVN